MNSMLGMLNNPETMKQMNEMMENPKVKEMLNNPEMMQNMMNMFGIPDMRNNQENISEDLVNDLKEKYKKIEELEDRQETNLNNPNFQSEDIVILNGLKTEKYNNKRGIIHSFNVEKQRYVVLLDEDDIKIMVKEENLFNEVLDDKSCECDSDEKIIQID